MVFGQNGSTRVDRGLRWVDHLIFALSREKTQRKQITAQTGSRGERAFFEKRRPKRAPGAFWPSFRALGSANGAGEAILDAYTCYTQTFEGIEIEGFSSRARSI